MSKESKMFYIQTSRVHCGEKKKKETYNVYYKQINAGSVSLPLSYWTVNHSL